ncbi:MAG: hypothetical protein ACYTJ0_04900 [Planctomycetota bacterium]|jgi:hypothetical protein
MSGTPFVALAVCVLLLSLVFPFEGVLAALLLGGSVLTGASVLPLIREARGGDPAAR